MMPCRMTYWEIRVAEAMEVCRSAIPATFLNSADREITNSPAPQDLGVGWLPRLKDQIANVQRSTIVLGEADHAVFEKVVDDCSDLFWSVML